MRVAVVLRTVNSENIDERHSRSHVVSKSAVAWRRVGAKKPTAHDGMDSMAALASWPAPVDLPKRRAQMAAMMGG